MSKDLFSGQSADYARYRPSYPIELIEYITAFVKEKNKVWDCATGNGQAAVLLAPHFKQVCASDLSAKQIQQATAHPKVVYTVCQAEQTPYDDNSFDLITVAQAYHWLNFDAFAKEAERVSKPGGTIAVWCYGLFFTEDDNMNRLIKDFYTGTVGPYWDKERKYIDEELKTVPFPYKEAEVKKSFSITVNWDINDVCGYISSWSSVQHFIKERGFNPLDELCSQLHAYDKDNSRKDFQFPVYLRIGKIEK
ncbi:MAG: class I SAM-dependent methyltransferase [Chitinophagaceae bacterium]|nr:class I SAM-dependent methyltransferase [Chitinophagaceae bacterium]